MLIAALLGGAVCGHAAPVIFPGGVVNAASFMPPPLAGSGIAKGSIFTIFGRELGPEEAVAAEQLPLRPSLAGVTIQVASTSGAAVEALPLFVSSGQVNAVMPPETSTGLNFVTVARDGESSSRESIKVVESSFGIFTRPLTAEIPVGGREAVAVAQNAFAEGRVELNSMQSPAVPGQTVVLWGTGLEPAPGVGLPVPLRARGGSALPAKRLGTVRSRLPNRVETSDRSGRRGQFFQATLPTRVEVFIGPDAAEVSFAGRSPCCAGVDQINFRVPENAPLGCFVPVSVRVRGVTYSNVETIAISADGAPCAEGPDSLAVTGEVSRSGRVRLSRLRRGDEVHDTAEGMFQIEPQTMEPVPAPGTCLLLSEAEAPGESAPLDAGPQLSLSGPRGGVLLLQEEAGYRASAPPGLLFLGPGAYSVTGPGGADVGSFTASLTVAPAPSWEALPDSVLQRNEDFELSWSGGAGALVSAALSSGAGTVTCSAGREPGFVEIPAAILTNLPLSSRLPRGSEAVELRAIWASAESEFSADGLDAGRLDYQYSEKRVVSLSPLELPSTPVRLPDGGVIQAELAAAFGERQRGLMNRTELSADRGMLFQFEQPGRPVFWMFGTLIPLDIIWLDSDRRIVFMATDTPPCGSSNPADCPTFGGQVLAEFVLELAAGQAEQRGLKVGDQLAW